MSCSGTEPDSESKQRQSTLFWFNKRIFLGKKLDHELQVLDSDVSGAGQKRQNRRYKAMMSNAYYYNHLAQQTKEG